MSIETMMAAWDKATANDPLRAIAKAMKEAISDYSTVSFLPVGNVYGIFIQRPSGSEHPDYHDAWLLCGEDGLERTAAICVTPNTDAQKIAAEVKEWARILSRDDWRQEAERCGHGKPRESESTLV
jgi:hypothetical protein